MSEHTSRRNFIKRTGASAGAIVAGSLISRQSTAGQGNVSTGASVRATGEIPRRQLGRTGVEVSIIGVGGSDIGKYKNEQEAIRIVQEAVDAGINFMDNAWEYNEGKSEEYMGKALVGRRDKVFLMTKVCTHGRDKQTAMR